MLRLIAALLLPMIYLLGRSLTETGSGGGSGTGSGGGGEGSGAGGQTGGAGTSGSGGGSGGTGTGQGTGEGAGAGAGTGSTDPWAGAEHDPARAKALIDKLRPYETRSAQLETQLTEAQNKLNEHEQANQTELERANTTIANLEADKLKLQAEMRELKARVLGGEMGIIDTKAASLLLKWDELGDNPTDEQVTAALTVMANERPWLTQNGQGVQTGQQQQQQQQTPDQSSTNGARSGSGGGGGKKIAPGLGRLKVAVKEHSKINKK